MKGQFQQPIPNIIGLTKTICPKCKHEFQLNKNQKFCKKCFSPLFKPKNKKLTLIPQSKNIETKKEKPINKKWEFIYFNSDNRDIEAKLSSWKQFKNREETFCKDPIRPENRERYLFFIGFIRGCAWMQDKNKGIK